MRLATIVSIIATAAAVLLLLVCFATPTGATYVGGIGYNLQRAKLNLPKQAHQVQFPEEDTSVVAAKQVREAAVICDPLAPVQRTVNCEIHTFDECGNPYGSVFNTTQGWAVTVQELDYSGSTVRLVSPIVWLEKGVGRFYWTPLRKGLHKVVLTRNHYPYVMDLQHARDLGAAAGFIVHVHDNIVRGTSVNFGDTNPSVQRMIWAQASHNAEPAKYPPSMPATRTFEDKEHRFDNRKWGLLQEAIRRTPVQPEAFPGMPKQPARLDDNAHRIVDYVQP